jgi:hypothetical protein
MIAGPSSYRVQIGFTYQWYLGTSTTVEGTGSTLTKRYCSPTEVTVRLVALATDGHRDDVTSTAKITYESPPNLKASISGPYYVELRDSTGCADITWIANASGGAPGYGYSWNIDDGTPVTGSTLTKRVCSPQTLYVKLTVRDTTAGATNNGNLTTTIYVNEPF